MSWSSILGVVFCAAMIRLLRAPSRGPASTKPARITTMRAAGMARLVLSIAAALLVLLELVPHAGRLPLPTKWVAWFVMMLVVVIWVGNAMAGLWLLSPFVGANPGLEVVAAGRRARVRRYGLTRLELTTRAGWLLHLPYWTIVYRPVLVRQHPERRFELSFRRPSWSDRELSFLRQGVILAPYRDVTCAVSVSRRADVIIVQLGLAHYGAKAQMQHLLEELVEALDAAPAQPVPASPPSASQA